jgi:hypothetical protein
MDASFSWFAVSISFPCFVPPMLVLIRWSLSALSKNSASFVYVMVMPGSPSLCKVDTSDIAKQSRGRCSVLVVWQIHLVIGKATDVSPVQCTDSVHTSRSITASTSRISTPFSPSFNIRASLLLPYPYYHFFSGT